MFWIPLQFCIFEDFDEDSDFRRGLAFLRGKCSFFLSFLSPAHAQCTRNCGLAPSASLTANGQHSITVGAGSTITYEWSSTDAASAESFYTVDAGPPSPRVAESLTGTSSGTVAASQVGHTYVITYAVTDPTERLRAFAQVTITVVSSLAASLTANGQHSITVGAGSTISYAWSSAYAASAESLYTVDGGPPSPWVSNSLSGISSGTVAGRPSRAYLPHHLHSDGFHRANGF